MSAKAPGISMVTAHFSTGAGRYEEARERLAEALTRQADKPHGNVLFYLAMTTPCLGRLGTGQPGFPAGRKVAG